MRILFANLRDKRSSIFVHWLQSNDECNVRIQVVSRSGRPLAAPMESAFDARGGVIGRSPDCSLVLPDPDRHISRHQARIDQVGRDFFITCLGTSNAIVVGGEELGAGQRSRLSHADVIVIGEYEMRVDLSGVAPAAQSGAPARKGFSGPEPGDPVDPFAEFESADVPANAPPPAETLREFAPDDASDVGEPVRAPSDPLGLGAAGPRRGSSSVLETAESIDVLFGLGDVDPDPLRRGSPLVEEPSSRDRTGPANPLASVVRSPRTPSASLEDRGSELSGAMPLPEAIPPTSFGLDTESPQGTSSVGGEPAIAEDQSRAPFLSWEGETAAADRARVPPGAREAPPARAISAAPRDAVEGEAPADEADALLQELLDGLGLPALPAGPLSKGQPPRTLTPELMRRIGELLRTASDGTIDLLRARTTLKREMQAEVTFIVTTGNNPLKFSPDSQAALAHLLSAKPVRGFMDPVPALRDAFDDLLAHQMGILAGMRAAMHGLLARFDPVALESRLAGRSVLDALVPSAREARLWVLFNERYAEISREAEDDFEELFGREFAKAYEEQIARLGSRRP